MIEWYVIESCYTAHSSPRELSFSCLYLSLVNSIFSFPSQPLFLLKSFKAGVFHLSYFSVCIHSSIPATAVLGLVALVLGVVALVLVSPIPYLHSLNAHSSTPLAL